MTSTFKVDDQRDLYLGDGQNLNLTTDQEATGLVIMHRCLMRLGENIFNSDEGVDYFGSIFNADPDLLSFQISLSDRILATPGVVGISKFDLTTDQDVVKYNIDIQTIFGMTNINNNVSY